MSVCGVGQGGVGRPEGGGMRGEREKGGYYVCWPPVDK